MSGRVLAILHSCLLASLVCISPLCSQVLCFGMSLDSESRVEASLIGIHLCNRDIQDLAMPTLLSTARSVLQTEHAMASPRIKSASSVLFLTSPFCSSSR